MPYDGSRHMQIPALLALHMCSAVTLCKARKRVERVRQGLACGALGCGELSRMPAHSSTSGVCALASAALTTST